MSLFKYYAPDSFDFICVEEGVSVRFSQPSTLNDIFELNPAIDLLNEDQLSRGLKTLQRNEDYKNLKIETQLNIVKDKNKQIEKILIEEIININDENFGILSLTRNINSRSMWSYYSNDHQGFMISFKTEDDEKIKFPFKFYSDSIEYKEEREINLLSSISNLNNKETKIIKSLFSKDSDWTHENEFRFVIHLNVLETKKTDKRGFPIHAYVLPEGQIEAIYLGVHANPSLERKAKFWIKTFAPSVKLFKAEPCNTQYKLNYRKINI